MAENDSEMVDVADLVGGGETGSTPDAEKQVREAATTGYPAYFTINTLEAVERDVRGDHEDAEQHQDDIMLLRRLRR